MFGDPEPLTPKSFMLIFEIRGRIEKVTTYEHDVVRLSMRDGIKVRSTTKRNDQSQIVVDGGTLLNDLDDSNSLASLRAPRRE